MSLDEAAAVAYKALQAGNHEEALQAISQALSLCHGRPRLQARLLSWEGQAYQQLQQLGPAQKSVLQGLAVARKCGDQDGVSALRILHRAIVGQLAAQQVPLDPSQNTLSRALAAFDLGNPAQGAHLAQQALTEAQENSDPRGKVLSLLALARSPAHTTSAILRAHQVAQESDDFNLVTAVARAAKASEVTLPAHVF